MCQQFVHQCVTASAAVIGLSSITGLLDNKDGILFKTSLNILLRPMF